MPRCMNCGSDGGEVGLILFANGFYCEQCNLEYEEYLEDNYEEVVAQERYENFLAEY
jgi:hypothetical protein